MSAHRRRVIYTGGARRQLSDILLFSEKEWGRPQRLAYARLLADATQAMADNPHIGRQREELAAGVRSYPVASHIVYYREVDNGILILRIMHFRRDPQRAAWSEEPGGGQAR